MVDPKTMAEIKDAAFLKRVISETQVAKRKCEFFAGLATNPEVQKIFQKDPKMRKLLLSKRIRKNKMKYGLW